MISFQYSGDHCSCAMEGMLNRAVGEGTFDLVISKIFESHTFNTILKMFIFHF